MTIVRNRLRYMLGETAGSRGKMRLIASADQNWLVERKTITAADARSRRGLDSSQVASRGTSPKSPRVRRPFSASNGFRLTLLRLTGRHRED
jgi:hypothetical protein